MAGTLSADAAAALRAHMGYLRDLGVYDFYRRGLGAGAASSFLSEQPQPNEQAAAASFETAPETRAEAAAETALDLPSMPTPQDSEEPEIAARKHALPTPPPLELPGILLPAAERAAGLAAIREEIGDCTRCQLAYEGRHTIVFGDGDPNAKLLFVGEGPGADEDMQGLPFVGKAGQLLNNMITAMGLSREQVYIANIVKCRPPANRLPAPAEANTCKPFLLQQLGVIRPQVIVALGATAATYLLGVKSTLIALRGHVHPAYGAKLIVTYHPAFLLRDPRQKKEAWADLQMAMRELARL